MTLMKSIVAIGFCTLTACGAVGKSSQEMASHAVENLGCKASQSENWNSLQRIVENGEAFPSAQELRAALLKAGEEKNFTGADYERYVDAFVAYYSVTVEGIQAKFDPKDPAAWQKALAEMEAGIRVTDVHKELSQKVDNALASLDSAEKTLQAACQNPQDPAPSTPAAPLPSPNVASTETVWNQLKTSVAPEVYGARRTLAVAYQSCDVLKLSPITVSTPNVKGILDYDVRPDGGHVRKVSSLSDLLATDYYINGQSLAKSSCFNIRKDPPIYNFGGKPYTTTSAQYNLDLFTHVNSGGPTLGIDCSAYVFSALALAGLKLDPDPKKILKASLVNAYGSGAFKEPQANGMRCLQKIAVTAKTSILPGDIAAINGHVVMVDAIGADPLAIAGIKSLADCTAAKINSANFDFVIAQSAPVKNGIGINRFKGADYMPQSATIKNGFIAYAVAACRAKFGAAPNLSSPNFSIVRHLKTAECTAPQPLTMTQESCVDSCAAL